MRSNPVDVPISRITWMMVDVDEKFAGLNMIGHRSQALIRGRINGDDTIKCSVGWFRGFQKTLGIHELEFGWGGILIPATHIQSLRLQGECQCQLRANAVSIRPDVADNTELLHALDGFKNLEDGFGCLLHVSRSPLCSISSMMSSTLFPIAMESSNVKRTRGEYLSCTRWDISCCRVPRCCWR